MYLISLAILLIVSFLACKCCKLYGNTTGDNDEEEPDMMYERFSDYNKNTFTTPLHQQPFTAPQIDALEALQSKPSHKDPLMYTDPAASNGHVVIKDIYDYITNDNRLNTTKLAADVETSNFYDAHYYDYALQKQYGYTNFIN